MVGVEGSIGGTFNLVTAGWLCLLLKPGNPALGLERQTKQQGLGFFMRTT